MSSAIAVPVDNTHINAVFACAAAWVFAQVVRRVHDSAAVRPSRAIPIKCP